ncbi:MAG TPA: hypothetical protein VM619_02525 [Luteimonas sp.]|nr:hypothetical protein [Luteimonas sp.]
MTCYIVAFEVADPANKTKLQDALKSYGTYCPINANCWAIVTDQSAAQVRDKLMATIPATDKIFVVKSGVEAAWRNAYGQKNSDWLKEKL